MGHPAVLVSYRFNGFLDDIYATLVVRLHHTQPFEQDQLWRYAADFKTLTGKQLGVKLTRRAEGAGELEVYFDPAIPVEEKIIFSRYVHEHLLQKARDVVRLRHYVCPHCGTPVGNREVAMKRLNAGWKKRGTKTTSLFKGCEEKPTIICVDCEKRVPLWDELEQHFASPETKQRVRELQEQSAIVLDNESKERALVGEVISTVALAGQLSREFNVSDHGIDMEIEFKSDAGEATGRKLYLQLKSGDSYLRKRKRDGAEQLWIQPQARVDQEYPVVDQPDLHRLHTRVQQRAGRFLRVGRDSMRAAEVVERALRKHAHWAAGVVGRLRHRVDRPVAPGGNNDAIVCQRLPGRSPSDPADVDARLRGGDLVASTRFRQQAADQRMSIVRIAAAGPDVQDDEQRGSGAQLHGHVSQVPFSSSTFSARPNQGTSRGAMGYGGKLPAADRRCCAPCSPAIAIPYGMGPAVEVRRPDPCLAPADRG